MDRFAERPLGVFLFKIKIMGKFIDRTGEVYTFLDGSNMIIVEYFGCRNLTIKFDDKTMVYGKQYGDFRKGNVFNPSKKSVYGVGYFGVGKYISEKNGKCTIDYNKWSGMFNRSYSDEYHLLKPTYKDCTVHPDWHNFQNFAKWFEENYVEGFELDKDVLIKGNKVYGPSTCCFVPREINTLMRTVRKKSNGLPVGVRFRDSKFVVAVQICTKQKHIGSYSDINEAFNAYKTVKEQGIKYVANKHKNRITSECYNALMNWEIDIND